MSRRVLTLFVFAVLSPGCIPVTEPVGDIDKAEPDKALVGSWEPTDQVGEGEVWVVERPEVKGNPKGLMRVAIVGKGKKREDVKDKSSLWFFATLVGKHTYANILLATGHRHHVAHLDKEGAYADWAKSDKRGYGIVRYEFDADRLTVLVEDEAGVKKLMKANRFAMSGDLYQTPAGWFAKHLEKNGPDGLFVNATSLTRSKKK